MCGKGTRVSGDGVGTRRSVRVEHDGNVPEGWEVRILARVGNTPGHEDKKSRSRGRNAAPETYPKEGTVCSVCKKRLLPHPNPPCPNQESPCRLCLRSHPTEKKNPLEPRVARRRPMHEDAGPTRPSLLLSLEDLGRGWTPGRGGGGPGDQSSGTFAGCQARKGPAPPECLACNPSLQLSGFLPGPDPLRFWNAAWGVGGGAGKG